MSFWSHISDVVSNVVEHPLPAIESLGLMSLGVDPITAGSIVGGGNAALNGGNIGDIASGALVGGLSGYTGGEASSLVGGIAPDSSYLSNAVGGATAGATTAALTGQDPIKGALTGGLIGAGSTVISNVVGPMGQTTTYFDDGNGNQSSITYDSKGTIISGTDSTGAPLPQSSIAQANQGAKPPVTQGNPVPTEDVKNITDTITKMQAANNTPAEIAAALKTQGYTPDQVISVTGPSTADQVNQAFNDATKTTPTGKDTYTSGPVVPGNQTVDAAGNTVITQDDGSTITLNNNNQVVSTTDSSGNVTTPGTNPKLPTNTQVVTQQPTTPTTSGGQYIPTDLPPTVVLPAGQGGITSTTPGAVSPSDTTPTPAPIPLPPLVNPGANPGWMNQAVKPMYEATSPNQAQYYWGAHPYAGPDATFANYDYNAVPNAPSQPWGAHTSAVGGTQQLNINDFVSHLLNSPYYNSSYTGAAPGTPTTPGIPVVPVGAQV